MFGKSTNKTLTLMWESETFVKSGLKETQLRVGEEILQKTYYWKSESILAMTISNFLQ
jgi:hypothetical protein